LNKVSRHSTRPYIAPCGASLTLGKQRNEQLKHIIEILEMTGWSVHGNGGSAELLEIKPTTLEARMKKLKIERKR